MTLKNLIKDKAVKADIVADCTQLVETQVATKKGLSGLALKATYGVVKGIGAKYIPGAIGRLLPEAFAALDPMWNEGLQHGDPVAYLIQNQTRTADTLLKVTDARIQHSDGLIRASYNKLRNSVKSDVESAVPELATIIGTHAQAMQNV
ncbi:MAG: hypothetical protein AAGH78_10915 [Cyanobacteria bacterium P01_H01_bin.58]